MIEFKGQLTDEDLVAAGVLAGGPAALARHWLALIGLSMFTVLTLLAAIFSSFVVAVVFFFVTVVPTFLAWRQSPVKRAERALESFRKSPLREEPLEGVANDEGVELKCGAQTAKLVWRTMSAVKDDDEHLLLFESQAQFYTFSRRMFSEEGWQEFRALAHSRVTSLEMRASRFAREFLRFLGWLLLVIAVAVLWNMIRA